MIIRMKTTSAGPNGSRYAGKEYPVDDAEGKALVDGGYAVRVGSVPEIEVATMPEMENAATRIRPIAKKRGR